MKTIQIILSVIICFSTGCCNRSHAQDSRMPVKTPKRSAEKSSVERSIGDRTYVYVYYDGMLVRIHNKKNSIQHQVSDCNYSPVEGEPIDNIVDKIFSAERKKELKGQSLLMPFFCDSSGNVVEITFLGNSKILPMLTLGELYALENAFLKHKVELKGGCPDIKYYLFLYSYRGLLEKSEKKPTP